MVILSYLETATFVKYERQPEEEPTLLELQEALPGTRGYLEKSSKSLGEMAHTEGRQECGRPQIRDRGDMSAKWVKVLQKEAWTFPLKLNVPLHCSPDTLAMLGCQKSCMQDACKVCCCMLHSSQDIGQAWMHINRGDGR